MQLFFAAVVLPFLVVALPAPAKEDIPCGTQAPGYEPIDVDGTGRIVGGEHAKPHSWPWAAALMQFGETVNCGGTLIDKRWLISAGHCFGRKKAQAAQNGYRIKLGADDHGEAGDQNEPSQQIVGVEKFWVHPNFSLGGDDYYATYDITLVKLDKDVTLNEFVRPICLPAATDRLQADDKVVNIGWGETEQGSEPKQLHQVVLSVIDQKTCQEDWNFVPVPLDETMVCAGNQTFGGISSCFGDSGGALMAHRDNKWVHYGIVSWGGVECALPKQPSVYGYVPLFVDWVHQIMQSEGQRR